MRHQLRIGLARPSQALVDTPLEQAEVGAVVVDPVARRLEAGGRGHDVHRARPHPLGVLEQVGVDAELEDRPSLGPRRPFRKPDQKFDPGHSRDIAGIHPPC